MATLVLEGDTKRHGVARRSGDECLWLRALGSPRPPLARLDTRAAIGWFPPEVDFIRRTPSERHVWPVFVEPIDVTNKFPSEFAVSHWHRRFSGEFRFEGSEESLDDCNTSVLAHRPITDPDSLAFGPFAKRLTVKDAVAIADEVLGISLTKGLAKERADRGATGLLREHTDRNDAA